MKFCEELLSVIVPVYNVEEYLERCIKSIVNQTYSNLEILLIDDGSTDNSGIICEKWKKKDNRIKVFHIKNKGVSFARNLGIEQANGKFISFIDSDDYMSCDMLEKMVKKMQIEKSDIVISNYNTIKNRKENLKKLNNTLPEQMNRETYLNLMIQKLFRGFVWNKLYKSKYIKKIKFDTSIKMCEDVLFNVEYAKYIKKAIYINEGLYKYCIRKDSVTKSSYSKILVSQLNAYDKMIKIIKDEYKIDPIFYKSAQLETALKLKILFLENNIKDKMELKKLNRNIDRFWEEVMTSDKIRIKTKIYYIICKFFPRSISKIKNIKDNKKII